MVGAYFAKKCHDKHQKERNWKPAYADTFNDSSDMEMVDVGTGDEGAIPEHPEVLSLHTFQLFPFRPQISLQDSDDPHDVSISASGTSYLDVDEEF